MRDDDFTIWPTASLALSYLKVRQENVVDAFLERLRKNPSTNLIFNLATVGVGSEKASNALLEYLSNPQLEQYVIWALGTIGVRNENVLNVDPQVFVSSNFEKGNVRDP